MSNQRPPYPPPMYPFYYPYQPPSYGHPMMQNMPKNPLNPMTGEQMPPNPYSMPPYGYPPYQMMYPPPHKPYFSHPEPNLPPRQAPSSRPLHAPKEKSNFISEVKKPVFNRPIYVSNADPAIVVLSDSSEHDPVHRESQVETKKVKQKALVVNRQQISQEKLRKLIKKSAKPMKIEPSAIQTRPKLKKRENKIQQVKSKTVQEEERQPVFFQPIVSETTVAYFGRSNRSRFLTAKDGRGKILIGDEYQAKLPRFLDKTENFSVWVEEKKKNLLSRCTK